MNLDPDEVLVIICAIMGIFIGAILAVVAAIYFQF